MCGLREKTVLYEQLGELTVVLKLQVGLRYIYHKVEEFASGFID